MITYLRTAFGRWMLVVLAIVVFAGYMKFREYSDFKRILTNLKAESRAAEVLVTESRLDEITGKFVTTIKFLEFDVAGKPLLPKYFTFYGNQIQFQALVVRFKDEYIEQGHRMKGKSIFLFLKAFVLDPNGTEVFDITQAQGVPEGYRVDGVNIKMQKEIWENFWKYA